MNKSYAIIGCAPRSGSVFMQQALNALGLKTGHEDPDKDGVVGWQHLCPGHPWTMKALRKSRGRRRVYMMQMRHPVPTINSIAAMYFRKEWPPLRGKLSVEYMCQFYKTDTPVIKAMRLYYHLNAFGMKDGKFKTRFHIETIDEDWPAIMEAMEMPGTPMPEVPKDTNSRKSAGKYPELDWRDIYDAYPEYGIHISRLASAMGYDVGDTTYTELFTWANEH